MTKQVHLSMTTLYKITKYSREYYKLLQCGPGPEHFREFVQSLPQSQQAYYTDKGFEGSRRDVCFRRFVLEQSGRRMEAYLKERLEVEEFYFWKDQDQYQLRLLNELKQLA